MFSYPERLLAFRYIRSRRREGFVSIIALFSTLGITLGVATLILVTSLMHGIREEMTSNFLGVDGHVTIYAHAPYIHDVDRLLGEVRKVKGVVSAMVRIEGQVMVSAGKRALGAQVFGLTLHDLKAKKRLAENITAGDLSGFKAGEGVVIGARLAENLGIGVGDSITLISPQGRATIAGRIPRIKSYPVTATFKLGMHALDSSLIYLPFEEARLFFNVAEGGATAIEVATPSPDHAAEVAQRIGQAYSQALRVYDWQTTNRSVFTALEVQQDVMVIILTLIILVAAFNIISSLIMLVQDKTGDIAILRTMGAERSAILRIFILSGMSTGVIGTILGVGLGVLAAVNLDRIRQGLEAIIGQKILVENIYFLSSLPTRTNPSDVLWVALLGLGLSFLATLYPAWKAASTEPAEALRYG